MKTIRYYILFVCIILTQSILAQVSFTAQVNTDQVPLNDMIQIDFTMNSDGDNFSPPTFEGFSVLSGPNTSVSYAFTNGRKSFKKSFSYILQPKRKGRIVIGKANVQIEGTTYQTEPITITVTDAVKRQDPRDQMANAAQQAFTDKIHLVAEVSKTNPYVNEPVTVVYKLYFGNIGLTGYRPLDVPTYDKFWTYNVELPQRPDIKQGTYQGQMYNYIVLKQDVVMAQEIGKNVIKPLKLMLQIEAPTGRRDFFGFPEYGIIEKEFGTQAIAITAKELPQAKKPEDFSGGVGEFSFKVTPSITSLKAGEPLYLTVNVTGKGNLNLVTIPTPVVHSALEMYDPEYSEKLTPTTSGLQGSRTNKYTIIPQYKGEYNIDPMSFSYFDLASKQYKTITTDTIRINVLEGPMLPTNKDLANTDGSVEDDLFQKNKTTLTFVKENETNYWNTGLFYFLLIVPLAAMPLFVLGARIRENKANDIEGSLRRRNNRLAKKYLANAKKHMNNKELFYEALERCLHNFLKAKLKIETSEMSNENIVELLQQKNCTPETIDAFIALKNACEWARYTPSDQVNITKDYETAIDVINQLEKQFKA